MWVFIHGVGKEMSMKFALIMPCWPRTQERFKLANECFATLMKTEPIETTPLLFLLYKPGPYVYPVDALRVKFWTLYWQQCHEGRWLEGVDQPLVYGSGIATEYGADYIVHLGEDTLFHPSWLWRLRDLIQRHPEARSWSVYRSSRLDIHKTLREEDDDVLVRSINGNGLCVSAAEWKRWGLNWTQNVYWSSANGTTIDMHHISNFPGERWVTRRSWIEHAGLVGAHSSAKTPEVALDFVGVET